MNPRININDREQTLHWLEESTTRHEGAPLLMNTPLFDFVRDDPRFQAIVARIGLPRDHR